MGFRSKGSLLSLYTVHVEPELLHTYSKVYKSDVILLIVRLAVLTAVTLTVPVVLFPVSSSDNLRLFLSRELSCSSRMTSVFASLFADPYLCQPAPVRL